MHIPVLLEETLQGLSVKPGGCYVDGTMGAGGHSEAILARGAGRLLGIDRDPEAIERCRKRLEPFAGRVTIARGNHSDLKTLAQTNGFDGVDGVLLDLGVSSYQLDTPERGFSFRADGPLDMRMDCDKGQTAAEWIATAEVSEMARIFRQLGQEPQALRVAKAIDKARRNSPIQTTLQLAGIVADALPGRRGPHHPATQVFQAIRMHINREMQELQAALDGALDILSPGGKLAVITFESLTDSLVKHFLSAHEGRRVSLQQGGERLERQDPPLRRLTRKVVTPGAAELRANPRSRSAKLRVAERLENTPLD